MSWRGWIAGLVVALLSTTAGAETFDAGYTAYMQGEYARSFEILKPLADKGDAKAAYIVGRQYQLGQGVARDLGQAWYWYRRAEAKGNIEAGLFRHLLVSKWKISDADRKRGEALFAALSKPKTVVAARIRMRPSPKPTPAVAPPASLPQTVPGTVSVSKLPRIDVRPTPQPAVKKAPKPTVVTRRETCTWCATDGDIEPDLNDRPQTAKKPAVVRGNDRAEGPAGDDAARRNPTADTWDDPDESEAPAIARRRQRVWRDEQLYAPEPPAVALAPGYRYWRGVPRPLWRRPGWRTRARWRRIPPGLARRWRRRGWRRY